MSYFEYKHKLSSLQYYIKSRSANTTQDLTKKLDVSRRTIMRMLENLRDDGVEIKYCKKRKAYFIE